jgi:hypothetical protein
MKFENLRDQGSPVLMVLWMVLALTSFQNMALAQGGSGHVGGGGEDLERRFYDVRDDIQNWIQNGGAQSLQFKAELTHKQYQEKMTEVLKPGRVEVHFTDSAVWVQGREKTCRGEQDAEGTLSIVCNRANFRATGEAEQYSLIHHEYAGLCGVETNDGSKSDYWYSKQIIGSLAPQQVLRLVVAKPVVAIKKECSVGIHVAQYSLYAHTFLDEPRISYEYTRAFMLQDLTAEVIQALRAKGYFWKRKKFAVVLNTKWHGRPMSILSGAAGDRFDEIAQVELQHSQSGHSFKNQGSWSSQHAQPDPKRIPYEQRLNQAKSVAERQAIQHEMSLQIFKDVPAKSALVTAIESLPHCDDFYGVSQ